ncbi:MAG: magnesium/cobalt transporter CorA [Dehalococcoidia bacterium]|nr:MAG: magnesium/cobalt transporter CorA [Dehalococcoidia bacterium]
MMPNVSHYIKPDGSLQLDLSKEDIISAYNSGKGLLWLDFLDPNEEDKQFLEEVFNFHHLAVEDLLSPVIHTPKVDDLGDYLFLVVHGINYATDSEVVETAELSIFLGHHFVVSGHNDFLFCIEAVKKRIETSKRPIKEADLLAHALIDTLIDNVLPTIDRMTEVSADIEDEVIQNPHKATLEAVMKLKRSTLHIHRVMAPQRDVLNRLSRGDFPLIKKGARIFYRDVYDHCVRITDLNQTNRDIADNILATYLSSIANKQNEVMKVLAIVAAVFLPLSLLAGIYGMNFENMPELGWSWGYFAVLGIMGFVIAGLIWRFWASNWITVGHRRARRIINFTANRERIKGYFRKVRIPGKK